jgi:predicted AAA+ superfamily ATPase
MKDFKRAVFQKIHQRALEKRRFIQILAGPRQVGKTTLAQQLIESIELPSHYVSADEPTLQGAGWIESQWETARLRTNHSSREALLIIDEVQKLPDWSETVKRLWDEDTRRNVPLKVILLGSSILLIQKGLSESLAGRFERIPVTHWSLMEMQACFGFSPEQFIFYGGYPGAADLIGQPERWRHYIRDSLIETTVSRDILLTHRVHKPALLRRLFYLACEHSGQILSYQKMIGQLQDAGNTTTLSHYLELLGSAGLLRGLLKYAGRQVRMRGSSPKLIVQNTALMSALMDMDFEQVRQTPNVRGRWVESAVGAHLLNTADAAGIEVYYWLEANQEVDFVLKRGDRVLAIEVKSTGKAADMAGLEAFERAFGKCKKLLVGGQGVSVEEFLGRPAEDWLE